MLGVPAIAGSALRRVGAVFTAAHEHLRWMHQKGDRSLMFPTDNGYFNLLHAAVREGEREPVTPQRARDPIDAFNAHLDMCRRCADHPFDLCPAGAELLKAAVNA